MKYFAILTLLITILNAHTYNYTGMQYSNKHKCCEMKNCKEAYFYLEVCGVKRLDRDKDSIPCKKFCK